MEGRLFCWHRGEPNVIESMELIDGELVVVRRQPCPYGTADGEFLPDYVFRDTYVAEDGKIVLKSTVQAKVTPERTIPENREWPEDGCDE